MNTDCRDAAASTVALYAGAGPLRWMYTAFLLLASIGGANPSRAAEPPAVPSGVIDRDLWMLQERFLAEVVRPNIEKYRKSDVTIQIVGADDKPLAGAEYEIHQTRQRFGFGASLAFFEPVEGGGMEHKPKPVHPRELELFPQVFNYSVIPFSGKWMYIEPVEGKRQFGELDKYVDWCTKHRIELEYHFLAGIPPAWLRTKSPAAIDSLLRKHIMELVDRYHDRIQTFQITDEDYYLAHVGPIIKEIRGKYPQIHLGISGCSNFYQLRPDVYSDIYRGLPDLKALKAADTPMDFYSSHGHKPYGVWPDARQIYDTMDKFASEGARFHIGEAAFPLGGRSGIQGAPSTDGAGQPAQILGPLRQGKWTPELQAEFAEWFYTVCFSHPACDAINYWNFGPDAQAGGAGLLDEKYQPKPIFNRLEALIRGEWMTNVSSTPLRKGTLAFRGFHGDYELTVKLPDGKVAKAAFSVEPRTTGRYAFKLNAGVLSLRSHSNEARVPEPPSWPQLRQVPPFHAVPALRQSLAIGLPVTSSDGGVRRVASGIRARKDDVLLSADYSVARGVQNMNINFSFDILEKWMSPQGANVHVAAWRACSVSSTSKAIGLTDEQRKDLEALDYKPRVSKEELANLEKLAAVWFQSENDALKRPKAADALLAALVEVGKAHEAEVKQAVQKRIEMIPTILTPEQLNELIQLMPKSIVVPQRPDR